MVIVTITESFKNKLEYQCKDKYYVRTNIDEYFVHRKSFLKYYSYIGSWLLNRLCYP